MCMYIYIYIYIAVAGRLWPRLRLLGRSQMRRSRKGLCVGLCHVICVIVMFVLFVNDNEL